MALTPASYSFSSVSAGIFDGCLTELKDHEMDGAGGSAEMQAGHLPRCDSLCGQRVGAKLDETELQDAQVQASGCENTGVFHVLNLHGNSQRSCRVHGWRTSLRRR